MIDDVIEPCLPSTPTRRTSTTTSPDHIPHDVRAAFTAGALVGVAADLSATAPRSTG